MIFKKYDVVLYTPLSGPKFPGYEVMVIIEFDNAKSKYLCMDMDTYTIEPFMLCYCKEDELVKYSCEEDYEDFFKEGKRYLDSPNYNKYSYELYDMNGEEIKLLRNAVHHPEYLI